MTSYTDWQFLKNPVSKQILQNYSNCLPVYDIICSFFEVFTTLSSLLMTSYAVLSLVTQVSSPKGGLFIMKEENNRLLFVRPRSQKPEGVVINLRKSLIFTPGNIGDQEK